MSGNLEGFRCAQARAGWDLLIASAVWLRQSACSPSPGWAYLKVTPGRTRWLKEPSHGRVKPGRPGNDGNGKLLGRWMSESGSSAACDRPGVFTWGTTWAPPGTGSTCRAGTTAITSSPTITH